MRTGSPGPDGHRFVQVSIQPCNSPARLLHIDPDQLQPPVIHVSAGQSCRCGFPARRCVDRPHLGRGSVAVADVVRATWTQAAVAGQSGCFSSGSRRAGDSRFYRLTINSPRIDRFFNESNSRLNKAVRVSGLHNRALPNARARLVDFPVDYLARDYSVFAARLDFAASATRVGGGCRSGRRRHAGGSDAALGDEFSYFQDRVAREAYLQTATRRPLASMAYFPGG